MYIFITLCNNILNKFEHIQPFFLQDEEEYPDGFLFVNLIESFKNVKDAIFGLELASNYVEVTENLKLHLHLAHIGSNVPLTPKLHIISTHVVQWVRQTGKGLAKANEAAGEAAHHIWWETY